MTARHSRVLAALVAAWCALGGVAWAQERGVGEGRGDEPVPAATPGVPEAPVVDETPAAPTAPEAAPSPAAPAARRDPPARMFSRADDRAERERLRDPAARRRRAAGDPEVLELAGMPDAWFFRPASGGRQRVFVYLHSRGANPQEACKRFHPVVARFGWLVCPVGPGDRGGGRRVWNNNATLARRYAVGAVDALRARFPRRVRRNDNVVMGFSEGAFVAMQTGMMEPVMFPRWVIFAAHDGYIDMGRELYPAARRALRRVYLVTGVRDEIVEHTRRAEALLRRHRLGRVQLRILERAGHELPPDFAPTVRRALLWVTR